MSDSLPTARQGDLLWTPSPEQVGASRMQRWLERLASERGLRFDDTEAAWGWSVDHLDAFWRSIVDELGVRFHAEPESILGRRDMPNASWLPGARLSYAEHALRRRDDGLAVIAWDETGERQRLTRAELAAAVAGARDGLEGLGVRAGDRVVAFAGNTLETLVAFLASASLGAVWSSCSPEFGVGSVLDRFQQVEPKVLLATGRSRYGGKVHDRRDVVAKIRDGLPSLEAVVALPGGDVPDALAWNAFAAPRDPSTLRFEPVAFDHPLWILYSSGTTGLPKAIVQGHGGILLEHLKALALHCDLGEGDRFFWYTTTGWMMWNFLVSGLLVDACVVLYDGSPAHPGPDGTFRLAAAAGVTWLGTSAPYLLACRKEDLHPGRDHDLSKVRAVGSTGAPLPPEGFAWTYERVGSDLLLGSISGGTDVCTAFALCDPTRPVHAGEIQARGLGCKVEAWDEGGRAQVGEVGELVITEPMPSMPVSLWNDPDGRRLRESYFDVYPGTWRHGDWIEITERGSCIITGRSDSTLNRGGVRMGTSEFYRVVEAHPCVADSLVVDTARSDGDGALWLFVVAREPPLTDDDIAELRRTIRSELSPRHVPDRIVEVASVPRTISGKKLEVPVKKILTGADPERAASRDSLKDPSALDTYVTLAREELAREESEGKAGKGGKGNA